LRVFGRQFELAAFATNCGAVTVGFDAESGVGALTQDGSEAADREHGGTWSINLDARHFVADADFKVGGHQGG
jgi:hypothetical protein